jgi:hypothetical protein
MHGTELTADELPLTLREAKRAALALLVHPVVLIAFMAVFPTGNALAIAAVAVAGLVASGFSAVVTQGVIARLVARERGSLSATAFAAAFSIPWALQFGDLRRSVFAAAGWPRLAALHRGLQVVALLLAVALIMTAVNRA